MPSRVSRRLALLSLAAPPAAALAAEPQKAAAPSPPGALPFQLHRDVPIEVRSKGVEWKGQTIHLVQLHHAMFQLSARARLTGKLRGRIITFDEVDYDVHAAVFDASGALLGTARALLPVERIWLGKVLSSEAEVDLDFGISDGYHSAKSFTVAVSQRRVLTPEEWVKEPAPRR
jgi:hypothetical protein